MAERPLSNTPDTMKQVTPPHAPSAGLSVLVVTNDLRPYGAQEVARTSSDSLAALGHRVTVATLDTPSPEDLILSPEIRRVDFPRHERRGAWGYLTAACQLRRVVRQAQPDLIISHALFSNVTILLSVLTILRRPPVVAIEHSTTRGLEVERSGRVLYLLARLLYPFAARVVGVSDAVAEDVRRRYHLRRDKVERIYNPVDVAAVRRRATVLGQPHRWIGGDAPLLICVAGFREAKGQELLIEAMVQMPTVKVLFAGDGITLERCKARVDALDLGDRVEFLGHRPDAAALVAASAVLVVPSRWEGFGLVAIEAGAVGTPVVATDVSGVNELVGRFVPGVLAASRTPEGLADAVRAVLNGEASGQLDLQEFDPATVAARYLRTALG